MSYIHCFIPQMAVVVRDELIGSCSWELPLGIWVQGSKDSLSQPLLLSQAVSREVEQLRTRLPPIWEDGATG